MTRDISFVAVLTCREQSYSKGFIWNAFLWISSDRDDRKNWGFGFEILDFGIFFEKENFGKYFLGRLS